MCIVSAFMSISLFVSPVDAKSEKKPLGPDYGTMTFGHYEQDGDEKNGEEPIEWIYIEVDGVGTVLISKYILDYYPKTVQVFRMITINSIEQKL